MLRLDNEMFNIIAIVMIILIMFVVIGFVAKLS